jgi:hypothetical protein
MISRQLTSHAYLVVGWFSTRSVGTRHHVVKEDLIVWRTPGMGEDGVLRPVGVVRKADKLFGR